MSITTEIVTMNTVPGVSEESFKSIVDLLEKNYHSKQEGFIDTELLFDSKDGGWTMIQHWQSPEQLKAASKRLFKDENAAEFVKSLDPKTVKMKILPQIKAWGK